MEIKKRIALSEKKPPLDSACILFIEGKEENYRENTYIDGIKNDSCNAVDVDFI